MHAPVVLEAHHISRRFIEGTLDVSVLQDVNLSVAAGKTLAKVLPAATERFTSCKTETSNVPSMNRRLM